MTEAKGPQSWRSASSTGDRDVEKGQSLYEDVENGLQEDTDDEKSETADGDIEDIDDADEIGPAPSANAAEPTELKRWVSGGNHHTGEPRSINGEDDDGRIPRAPLPLTRLDEGIVGWEDQDDPAMPLNFPRYKKWLIVGLLSAITFVTPFASSILAPGIESLSKEFENENSTIGSMTVSIYLLGYCVGPLFLAPLSEMYGRRPVIAGANVFFCVWQMACALAPNIESFIVFRFFCGVGGAGSLVCRRTFYGNALVYRDAKSASCADVSQTIGPGVISDVFYTDDRGFAMGIFNLGPIIGKFLFYRSWERSDSNSPIGPTAGPIVGGFVSNSIGWRWSFWIVLILGAIITILIEIFSTETNPKILMKRKVARMCKELGRDDLKSCYDPAGIEASKSATRTVVDGLIRPTKLLFLSPLVSSMSLYIAYNYGLLYLLFTTIPDVYRSTYGWSTAMSGLVYISFGVGNIAGWIIITTQSDKKVVQLTRANNNKFIPEMRLTMCPYFACITPITFFWYGWTAYHKTHWIWPILGLMPFGAAMIGLFLPITTYLVDCYPFYGASVIAANTVLRSLVGALLPLAGPSMYDSLGLGWGNSVLGFLCLVLIPLPTLMRRYGGKLRKMERIKLE